jgi:hypothetical protein
MSAVSMRLFPACRTEGHFTKSGTRHVITYHKMSNLQVIVGFREDCDEERASIALTCASSTLGGCQGQKSDNFKDLTLETARGGRVR